MKRLVAVLSCLICLGLPFRADALITVVSSATAGAASGANSTTTGAIDTSGAATLVLGCMWYAGTDATVTASDSKSNSWTSATQIDYGIPAQASVQWWYTNSASATVGGSHTATCAATDGYGVACFIALAGTDSTPFEQTTGNSGDTIESINHGAGFTPDSNNQIVLSALVAAGGGLHTVNGGFTEFGDVAYSAGVTMGGTCSYLIQTTAAAANPTVSWTGATAVADSLIAFDLNPVTCTTRMSTTGVGC